MLETRLGTEQSMYYVLKGGLEQGSRCTYIMFSPILALPPETGPMVTK